MFIRSGYSAHTRSVTAWSGIQQHHHAADVVGGGGDVHSSAWAQAGSLALLLQPLGADHVQGHALALHQASPTRGQTLSPTLNHHGASLQSDGGGLAAVHRA